MSVVNNIVKISDIELLQYFYPNFLVKETLFFDNENNIIYKGNMKPNIKEYLKRNTKNFISLVGIPERDLDNKDSLLDFVYEKHNKVPKDKVREIIKNMSDLEFKNYIKSYWVSGSSILDKDCDVNIFDLYKAMVVSPQEAMKVYTKMIGFYNSRVILRSLETFIEKAVDVENVVSKSGIYLNLLRKYREQNIETLKLKLMTFLPNMGKTSDEYKILWILVNLTGKSLRG